MHINQQPIIATSFIAKDGDEKNQCYLSKKTLFVRYRNRLESFELSSISDIQFKHKLLLFPLIAGGIIAPLCFLALLKGIGNPWLILSGLVLGLLMAYYGYEGSPTLSITTRVKEFDFFIKNPTPNLFAFSKYARQIFKNGEKGSLFYFEPTNEQLNSLENQSTISFEKETTLLYLDETKPEQQYLAVDPLEVPSNFRLINKENKVIPIIQGQISSEYIIDPNS